MNGGAKMKKHILPFLFLTATSVSLAEVYKCVSPEGHVSFSNSPFCEHRQAYAKNRNEPLQTVKPAEIAKAPPEKIIELYYESADLPDLLEDIGRFAGLSVVPIGLEGNEVKIKHVSNYWLELFNEQVSEYDLDYRTAYGHLYIYKVGSMGETIVHNPDLLRWYQSDDTWDVVMRNDDVLMSMKAFENSDLKDRVHRLVNMVREDLDEKKAVNAAESVNFKANTTSGVSSGIVVRRGDEEARREEEKAKRITARRQAY